MKMTRDQILQYDNVPVKVAADILNKTAAFVRIGLQTRTLPIGSAVLNQGGHWSYHISPGMLLAYQEGTINIQVNIYESNIA